MSIQLSDNIRVGQRLPLESKYFNGTVPYTNVAQAETLILTGLRHQGLTVNIAGVEYWFKNGIANGDLVIKESNAKLVALPFTIDHLAITNNQYVINDLVYYSGNVYRCIANNDSLQPDIATQYWTLLGTGFPLVQQPSNWNSTSGNNQILNKPTIPAAQVNSDWNAFSGLAEILNKPSIPAAQVNSDWNATSGLAEILNKPTIPTVGTWGALNYPTWTTGTPFVKMDAAGSFILDTTVYQPLLVNPVLGTGTTNYVPKWSNSSSLGDSIIQQVGINNIQIGSSSLAGLTLDLFSSDRVDFRMYPYSTTTDYFGIYSYGPTGYGSSYTQIGLNDGITSNQQGAALYLDTRASLPPLSLMVKDATTNVMTYALSVATNGNVGIGTTTPGYKLDVNGIVNATAINFQSTIQTGIYGGSNLMEFWAGNNKLSTYRLNGNILGSYFEHTAGFTNNGSIASGSQNVWRLAGSVTATTAANAIDTTQLLIDPGYNQGTFGTGKLRGVYYNPTVSVLNGSKHTAWENTSGDIIHGNLATGGAAQMVTADSNGKLGTQTIPSGGGGTVTSVDLTMPSAFTVTGNPVTTSGTLAVTGAGSVSQYIRGDGTLANFPNSTGGGASVNYYLNGSISQGTFGGATYYQMSKTPVLGSGTNFIRTNGAGNGYIASFITDAGDPSQLNIPGGNWNLEFYFQSSSPGGSPSFYAELYKVDVTNVFTLIGTGVLNPESITNSTAVDQYFTSLPVPQTTLLATDRLAIRIFVTTSGRNITLHTENGNLAEVLTTLTTGLTALNGLTAQVQNFATGTSGTDFNIQSSGTTHTFNIPMASTASVTEGLINNAEYTTFNNKASKGFAVAMAAAL